MSKQKWGSGKKDGSNLKYFLFFSFVIDYILVKGKNDTEMEKTMKYMKAGERLSKLAQEYGDFIVLIPEVFMSDLLQQVTWKYFYYASMKDYLNHVNCIIAAFDFTF